MRHYFLLILLLLSPISVTFGQAPTAKPSPSATPQSKKDFGSSLKKYQRKQKQPREQQAKPKSIDPDEEEVVRVETNLVINDVLVTNQKGNLILGLQKEDFLITEDGVPQKVETFSVGEGASIPRSIAIIIDCGALQAPYMKTSIAAAKLLVDKLNPNDKMAIVTGDLKLRAGFTQDKALLTKALDSIEPECDLNIEFDTLLAVLNEMFEEENRQRIVIFQGDGAEVIWLKQDKDTPYTVSYPTLEKNGLAFLRTDKYGNFGLSDVREAIERSRASIYSVIVGGRFLGLSKEEQLEKAKIVLTEWARFRGRKEKDIPEIIREYQYAEAELKTAGQAAMFKVSELSGGFADFIERPEDAENIYTNVFTVIKNRYLLGYYPTNQQRDGRRRQIKVEVRGHPEYTVTGLKAYVLSQ